MSELSRLSHEIASGEALSLAEAARLFPGRKGTGVVPSAVWRWAKHGAKSRSGAIVHLESLAVAGRTVTSRGAVARFLQAMNAIAPEQQTTTATASQRAAAELERIGA